MTGRRIKLLEIAPPLPPSWPSPLDESIRWASPYEAQVNQLT